MDSLRNVLLIACCLVMSFLTGPVLASEPVRRPPPVKALVTNFYYDNLQVAKAWYVDEMGFQVIYDDGWVVIVEVGKGMQIALVDASKGALHAVKNKGAMLAIETAALEQWHEYVRKIDGIEWYPYNGEDPRNFKHGIRAHGDYEEFRVLDPGGYIIEFYRWESGKPQ